MSRAIDWLRFHVLAADMDGTLAGADHRVTPRTLAALERAEQNGLRVVLVTGRAYPTALAVWRTAGLCAPIITCGGALTLQPPSMAVLDSRVVAPEAVDRALNLGRLLDVTVSLWTREGIWVSREGRPRDVLEAVNQLPVRVLAGDPAAPLPYGPQPVLKIMFGAPPSHMDRVQQAIAAGLGSALTVVRSMAEFMEATAPGVSKEGALLAVLERLGLRPEQVIAVGDGENDIGMLRTAGLGVAPVSGMAAVKQAADLVIGHHDEEGVARFLEDLLARRIASGSDGPNTPDGREVR